MDLFFVCTRYISFYTIKIYHNSESDKFFASLFNSYKHIRYPVFDYKFQLNKSQETLIIEQNTNSIIIKINIPCFTTSTSNKVKIPNPD